jgi:hypothetical protein
MRVLTLMILAMLLMGILAPAVRGESNNTTADQEHESTWHQITKDLDTKHYILTAIVVILGFLLLRKFGSSK